MAINIARRKFIAALYYTALRGACAAAGAAGGSRPRASSGGSHRRECRGGAGGKGGLAAERDCSEILALGIEYLNACYRRDVEAVVTINRHALGPARFVHGDVMQFREGALVCSRAVGLNKAHTVGLEAVGGAAVTPELGVAPTQSKQQTMGRSDGR